MHIKGKSVDDLLRGVFSAILKKGVHVSSTKGDNRELFGVLLELSQPLARLSRTESKGRLFSALGELLWYLSGSNELAFIEYYLHAYRDLSEDEKTLWGAYGPRLFDMRGINQLDRVTDILKRKLSTRQAVIQLFNAEDISDKHKDVPCTCTLQFVVRNDYLNLFVSMRSNDAFIGLPHDVFAFTMLQEIMARVLKLKVGVYKHAAGSLHLYDRDAPNAQEYLDEGWQSTAPMPAMPAGDPWKAIRAINGVEADLRNGKSVDVLSLDMDSYWKDFAILLKIYALTRQSVDMKGLREVALLKSRMSTNYYVQYIRRRERKVPSAQLGLPDIK